MKVWELLDKPEKWIKGAFAKTAADQRTNIHDSAADKWCVLGAIRRCYDDQIRPWHCNPEIIEILGKLGTATGMGGATAYWNDQPERTYEEVHTILKELDI